MIGVALILKDSAESHWKKRFKEQVQKGISTGNLKSEDMPHLHERWMQDRQSVLYSLRIMLSDSISGEDDKLKDKSDILRKLIARHEEIEPYSELPENISIQLKALNEDNGVSDKVVKQLATSLTDLYSSNNDELSKQKKYTFWGFLVGILGVLISLSSLYIAIPKN